MKSCVIEASAGTGKTHTIANLVVEQVIAGVPIDRILVMTFTRAATAELKMRIRKHLLEARHKSPKVEEALKKFLDAPISTIHSFCAQVLQKLTLVPAPEENRASIDALLFDIAWQGLEDIDPEELKVSIPFLANKIARQLKGRLPVAVQGDLTSIVAERLQRIKVSGRHYFHTQDDLLHRMVDGLPLIRQDLADAVIVDEFQDTDPLQWKILSGLFLDRCPLYLIGDPKQSIYSFRRADVYTYMEAKQSIDHHVHLSTNWRSSKELIDVFNALFAEREWLHLPRIHYKEKAPVVEAAKESMGQALFIIEGKTLDELRAAIVAQAAKLDIPFDEMAVLVDDRIEAGLVEKMLKEAGIPCTNRQPAKSRFVELKALVEALLSPEDPGMIKALLMMPQFIGCDPVETRQRFSQLKEVWIEKGFAAAALRTGAVFDIEELAEEEWMRDPLLPGRVLNGLESWEAEAKEGGEGVAILSIHKSKGLEFRVVFALGLCKPAKMEALLFEHEEALHVAGESPAYAAFLEEQRAEKLRQFYVAVTRAKQHLFLFRHPKMENSPQQLFLETVGEDLLDRLCEKGLATIVKAEKSEVVVHAAKKEVPLIRLPPPQIDNVDPVLSFTALQQRGTIEHANDGVPSGAEVGVLIHEIFEEITDPNDRALIEGKLRGTILETHIEKVCEWVLITFHKPLNGFCLANVKPALHLKEVEFLHRGSQGMIKGYIDSAFEHEGKFYLIDWKTHALPSYDETSLRKVMEVEDYTLQARLYGEAFADYLKPFGGHYAGIFYIFVRGGGVLFIPAS